MKSKKNISDLIRENQHQLDERPSPRAWRKLESKLENHNHRNKTFLYRQLAMAAAVVALVAVISLLAVLTNKKNQDFASDELAYDKWLTHDLETISTGGSQDLREMIEFQRKLKNRYPNEIKEGTLSNKLLASNQPVSNQPVSNAPNTNSSESLIAFNQKPPKTKIEKVVTKNDEIVVAEAPDPSMQNPVESDDFMEAEIVEQVSIATEPPIAEARKEAVSKNKAEASKKLSNGKVMTDEKMGNAQLEAKEDIGNDLSWLIGSWKGADQELNWVQTDNSSYNSEDFSIQKIQGYWSFIVKSQAESPYLFQESWGGIFVFLNKNGDKIILTHKGKNSFLLESINNSTGKSINRKYDKQ